MSTIYGVMKGVAADAPIAVMYRLPDGGGMRIAERHHFARWLPVSDDPFLGVDDVVSPENILAFKARGKLREFDDFIGEDEQHRVLQFAVAIQKVDVVGIVAETHVPSLFVACAIEHNIPGVTSYYTAERGLLQPSNTVRRPVSFAMSNRSSMLKKWNGIVEAWEDEEEFEVGRFVLAEGDEWRFAEDNVMAEGSSLYHITTSWLGDAEVRRQAEIKKLMEAPIDEMDEGTFAQLFQKKMVEGR